MSRHPLASVLTGCMTVLVASCDNGRPPMGPTIRDSTGVVIVDHGSLDLESLPPWRLEEVPEVSIGVLDGDEAYQFYNVADARRRRDGSLAVVDRSRTIRVFDSLGAHLWTAGGEGDGPGEFRSPHMVREIRGDSLVVWDVAVNRLSVFAPDGVFARTTTVHDFAGYGVAWGLSGPDRLLVEHRVGEHNPINGHEAFTVYSNLYLIDLNGQVVHRFGRWPLATEYQEVDSTGGYSPAIFAAVAVIASAPDGFWYGDTETYELRLGTASGGIKRILRWQGPGRTITDSDVDAVLDVWDGGPDASPELKRFIRAYGRTHPRADQFAAYEEILTDAVGRLWVRDFVRDHVDDGLRRWTVFSPDGTHILGRLTHSKGFEPHDVGEDWMLGVETGDLDVERVLLRKIVR